MLYEHCYYFNLVFSNGKPCRGGVGGGKSLIGSFPYSKSQAGSRNLPDMFP